MQAPHSIIAAYLPTFLKNVGGIHYIRRGVFWSELLAFSALAHHKGATHVVESSTGLGFSPTVLYCLFMLVTTIGQEDTPPGLPSNVYPLKGDAWEHIAEHIDDGCAILIDGPKGAEAALMAEEICAFKDNRPALIAIHDCQRGSLARKLFTAVFPDMWFSDDEAHLSAFGHLDRECLDMAASRGKTFADHGPTLGILVL